ncbi:MAG TPA: acyl-[acyl-carrier-protein]--UDP-N-acetylglucosamine O-acyltransferase, partial [Spirochaetes bacterium]|nr:acyl-[acyl-carrier-protein]--UDP-N-acetylglucosamine O-acyltransferase [Spirochaetota bacterium]
MAIHPTAIVEKDVQIDKNVDIDAYSIIRTGVSIGEGTRIATHVEISPNVQIARDNQIFKGVYLGAPPQDISYERGDDKSCLLEIGSGNVFREYVTVHHGSKRATLIGHSNYFMAYSHIAHDCVVGDHITLANYAGLAGWVEVA